MMHRKLTLKPYEQMSHLFHLRQLRAMACDIGWWLYKASSVKPSPWPIRFRPGWVA